MYCSNCDAYIPSGLNLTVCPSCEIDIVNIAVPRERRELPPLIEEPPPPPPVEKKFLWDFWQKVTVSEQPGPPAPKLPRPVIEYHLFQSLFLSFFSPSFYYDVAKRWPGACISHLTVITMIVALFFTVWIQEKYTAWHDDYLYPIVNEFPSLAFQGGKMMMLDKNPYVLVAKTGLDGTSQRIIFDSAGSVSANNLTSEWLVSPSAIFFKDAQQMLKTIPYDAEMQFKVNREILYWAVEQFRRWLPFFMYLTTGSVYWIFLLGAAFLYSLAGIPINFLLRNGLDYPAIFRLSAIAVTPAALVESVTYSLLHLEAPWLNAFFFFTPLFYLILSAVSVRWIFNQQAKRDMEAAQRKQAQKRNIAWNS